MSPEPYCHLCTHWRKDARCDAFPLGVPPVILSGLYDHREPYTDDKGITFAPSDKAKTKAERPAMLERITDKELAANRKAHLILAGMI